MDAWNYAIMSDYLRALVKIRGSFQGVSWRCTETKLNAASIFVDIYNLVTLSLGGQGRYGEH
jgi:hypothetical protein